MNNQHKTISLRIIVQLLFLVVLMPFLPLLISWNWDWWEAWVYAIISILGFAISRMDEQEALETIRALDEIDGLSC